MSDFNEGKLSAGEGDDFVDDSNSEVGEAVDGSTKKASGVLDFLEGMPGAPEVEVKAEFNTPNEIAGFLQGLNKRNKDKVADALAEEAKDTEMYVVDGGNPDILEGEIKNAGTELFTTDYYKTLFHHVAINWETISDEDVAAFKQGLSVYLKDEKGIDWDPELKLRPLAGGYFILNDLPDVLIHSGEKN